MMRVGILILVISLLVVGVLATTTFLHPSTHQITSVKPGETDTHTTVQTAMSPSMTRLNLIAKLEGDAIPLWFDRGVLYLAHGLISVVTGQDGGGVDLVKLDVGSDSMVKVTTLRDDWRGQVYLHLAVGQPIFDSDKAYFLMENMQLAKIVDLNSGEMWTVDRRGTYLYFVGAGAGVLYALDAASGDISLVAIDNMGNELWRSPREPLVLKDPYQYIIFRAGEVPRFLLVEANGFVERSGGWFATPTLLTITISPDGKAKVERRHISGEIGPMPAISSGGWAAAARDGYYVLVVFGQRLFLCRLGVEMSIMWCNDFGEYRIDLSNGGILLHTFGEGVLVGFPYQYRLNTTYEAYGVRIRLAFYGQDGKLVWSSNYTPNDLPFNFNVVGEHGGSLYALIPDGKQFIGPVSQGTKITLVRIGRDGTINAILSVKDFLAAELFRGEDPWSYRFSDDIHAIIIDNKLILTTKASVKDHVYTYVVAFERILQ